MTEQEAAESRHPASVRTSLTEPPGRYLVAELLPEAKRLFGASPDILQAASRLNGIKEATLDEARSMIDEFRKRKV